MPRPAPHRSDPLAAFHPTLAAWFQERLGAPTPPQVRAWPAIRRGEHTLVAAPTGSGKTLAAFLAGLDGLLRAGHELPDSTQVLYVSPLRALSNDIQKNLLGPLEELRQRDASLPEVRVLVRSGDTPQSERAKMLRKPPHVLVTTPESLYILLTSRGGQELLRTVRSVIVDEIHALLGSKRGSHLALSLERLDALTGNDVQRIGLSATQKPLSAVGRFLTGVGRECTLIDEGHQREMELRVEIPPSPLEPVCSHETWGEIYDRVVELAEEHRTTLVFVGTRKVSERMAARMADRLGKERVTCHHSSLSKERRLDAEARLKNGELSVLIATASLELGIDIGDIDLVVQIGAVRSIATLLQRVGRAGHGVGRLPKGVVFPLSPDELVEAAAVLRCVRRHELDVTPQPSAPLDILAQQVVAACAFEPWDRNALFERLRRAWPYRDLRREDFDRVCELHAQGRYALLHADGVQGRLRGTRRAALTAVTGGGAIPDRADYRVLLSPGDTFVGTVDEDFAVEASQGDVFQLGATSWRVLKVEPGIMRVGDATGVPPSLPFWFGEAPARTRELSESIGIVREQGRDAEWLTERCGLDDRVAAELQQYLEAGAQALGAVPTQRRLVLERFFDETGGTQIVLHAPFGARINRAFGLALRKCFCRSFGFELQAAANEESIILSLGPQSSFELIEVFDYLSPVTVEKVLRQALLAAPLFQTRWRWNVTRSLWVARYQGGRRVPAPLLRMRAEDRLAEAFPDAVACGENLPAGDIEIPAGHPILDQTFEDCLQEALDLEGLVEVLQGLRDGTIERFAIDTPEPSPFARGALAIGPYGFLDDAPLEERRTQAVLSRRSLNPRSAQELADLDPAAVEQVCAEAWPDPRDAEEVHEALLWMGYITRAEAGSWAPWLASLAQAGRVQLEGDRWMATEASRDPLAILRGRMECLGPVHSDDPLMLELESQGHVLRVPWQGRPGWCDRRLLARIQRLTIEDLRKRIRPVSPADHARFLAAWQHVAPGTQHEGPQGVREVIAQLSGWEAPVPAWESSILPARVRGYRPEFLDQLGLAGEIAWGRLWGSSRATLRVTPIALFPRAQASLWTGLSQAPNGDDLGWPARAVLEALRQQGALFTSDLEKLPSLLPSDIERGLDELIAAGLVHCDSFLSLRQHLTPPSRRRRGLMTSGRWSRFRLPDHAPQEPGEEAVEVILRTLIARYGVVFRAILQRERIPVPWRDLWRAGRRLELRGELRGGRFVAGHAGEQFASEAAVRSLRDHRRENSEGEPQEARQEFPSFDPLSALAELGKHLAPLPAISS